MQAEERFNVKGAPERADVYATCRVRTHVNIESRAIHLTLTDSAKGHELCVSMSVQEAQELCKQMQGIVLLAKSAKNYVAGQS